MITPDYIAAKKGVTFTATEETQLWNMIPGTTELVVRYLDNCFDTETAYTASTISFDGNINDSVSGMTDFIAGQWITVDGIETQEALDNDTGSQFNAGFYYLETASGALLDTRPETETEAAGRSITLTVQFFPRGLKDTFCDMVYYDFKERSNVEQERIGTYSYKMVDIGGVSYPETIAGRLRVYKVPKFR